MKKSPFSTPRGNGAGRQGFGWKSGGSPGRGYGRPINYEYYSPNRSQTSQSQSFGDDFIPFESCTPPSSDRKSGGNWKSSKAAGQWQSTGHGNQRHSVSPRCTSYRDNRGRDNYQRALYYKDGVKSFHGQCKLQNFHRGSLRGRIDISRYMNLRSFLEDPWAELIRKWRNNDNCNDLLNDTSASDFSFNSSALDVVCLNDSVDEDNLTSMELSSQEEIDDNFVESEASIKSTSQESANISSETSLDAKINRNIED